MPDPIETEFAHIVRLVPRLYFKLSALASELLRECEVSPGQRSLIEDIAVSGPQTIAALARARPVAKQYVQKLMADLTVLGFVELIPNPHDGRSKLVMLTDAGTAVLTKWQMQERAVAAVFLESADPNSVRATRRLLADLDKALEEGSDHSHGVTRS